jgi:NTP pyrophosphatase (non-canonical NTP hydrolase)
LRIRDLQRILVEGNNPYIFLSDSQAVLLHFAEETGELLGAYRKKYGINTLRNELGDCMILLCFVAESLGIDLQSATLDKIDENIKKGKFQPKVRELFDEIGAFIR